MSQLIVIIGKSAVKVTKLARSIPNSHQIHYVRDVGEHYELPPLGESSTVVLACNTLSALNMFVDNELSTWSSSFVRIELWMINHQELGDVCKMEACVEKGVARYGRVMLKKSDD